MINEEHARRYCYQDISLIENYENAIADKSHTWDCHHRVEDIMNCGAEELIAQGCYENRPAHDLIFLPHGEHSRLHKVGKKNFLGHKHTAQTRAKISASSKGNKNFLGHKHSDKTREKISASLKGHKLSAEWRAKIGEKARATNTGRHWFNNGIENKFCKECPGEGWAQGML